MTQPASKNHVADASADCEEEQQPAVGRWLCVVVVGMVILQCVRSNPSINPNKKPGHSRGDVSLPANVLPEDVNGWTLQKFDAPVPETLPDQQFWWTHSWQFQDSAATAIVSFDQADWHGWHELTECYLANGWKMLERTVHTEQTDTDEGWSYVVATFERGVVDRCMVVFSLFYSTGAPVEPRGFNFGKTFAAANFTERIERRVGYAPEKRELLGNRALQCQAFLPYRQGLEDEVKARLIQLHLSTRRQLKSAWREHHSLTGHQSPATASQVAD